MKHNDQYYLENAPIQKAIAHLSIPMMFGMSVGVLYNILNAFFIGLLHNTAMLSSVTLGLPIFTVLMAIGNIFGVGGSTYISRLLGEKKEESVKAISSFVFYGSLMAGILVFLVFFIFINPIVHLLGSDYGTFFITKNYSIALLVGSPLIIANFAMEQIVRSEGATKVSMNGMFINTIASVILDPLLILLFHLNVVGAAISMGIANGVSLGYYSWYLNKRSEHLTVSWKSLKITKSIASNVFKIGISEFLLSILLIISTLMLNHYSIMYSEDVIAGFGIALRIVQFPEFLCMGLFMGVIPMLAFTYGAKNIERYKQTIKHTFLSIGLLVLVFSSIVFSLRTHIIELFSKSLSVVEIGTYILTAMLISTVFNGFTGFFISIFQAAGKTKQATIMSVTHGALFIPIIIILHTYFGLHGIIWSLTATELLTCLMGILLFLFMGKEEPNFKEEIAV
ncbi:MAG: MATE family efflux transporter [Bacillota bacterium]|nr:MATE family efflux transporter [Bacillota bacterium]